MAQGPSTTTNIIINKSGSQVVFTNPAVHPLQPGSGLTPAAATKSAGQPNGSVIGQIAGTSVVFNNPA